MKDFSHQIAALDQRASATVTVSDFAAGKLTAATGTITVSDFAQISAGGTNTVTITITDYTQLAGKTVTLNGETLTEGVGFNAATSNANAALELAGALGFTTWSGTGGNNVAHTGGTNVIELTSASAITFTTNATGGISIVTTPGGAADTITVGGTVLTAGVNFTASTDNDTTAESIKTAVHALASVNATRTGAVVTVTAASAGTAGNAITIAKTSAGVTLSGATLSGGKNAAVITVNGTAVTETADFSAATSNEATATSLASGIDALAGFKASAVGNVVTLFWETPGTAGNAKTLTTNLPSAYAVSGATLAGGVAETLTEALEYSEDCSSGNVETTLSVSALTGTSPTVAVTPQYSYDKSEWFDHPTAFTTRTTAGSETLDLSTTAIFMRFKIVLGGTNPVATGKIYAVAK